MFYPALWHKREFHTEARVCPTGFHDKKYLGFIHTCMTDNPKKCSDFGY